MKAGLPDRWVNLQQPVQRSKLTWQHPIDEFFFSPSTGYCATTKAESGGAKTGHGSGGIVRPRAE